MLECEECRRNFVIQRRIPQMLPKHLDSSQKKEMSARDDQVEEYDGNIPLMLFGIVEIPYTIQQLDLYQSAAMLEAGCGTGRMTEQLACKVKELVSVDFSFKSLVQNELKLQGSRVKNVHLIQADICNLPLKSALFDRAISCQVVEHVPSDELRIKAVSEITRTVRPGSTVVVSAYQHSKWSKDKEGEHDGGIPFFRFTEEELTRLLETSLEVNAVSGLLIYLYVAQCRKPL
jgi:ubiquinone/menaquinone biosynthesis C-methylase UbiE